MKFFKSSQEKQLDSIIDKLNMDMSNNYKDNANADIKEFETALDSLRLAGEMKESVIAKYDLVLKSYKEKMKGYSHKDQKPYW